MASLSAVEYLTAAVTVVTAAALLAPPETMRRPLYDIVRAVFNTLGLTHAKPVSDLGGGEAPFGLLLCVIVVCGASALTGLQILDHLRRYVHPTRQRYVIRILLIVPIYAIDSLWSYLSFQDATWISIARDTYEAYVLYNFFALLMDFLGGPEGCEALWRANKQTTMAHSFPLNYVLPEMSLNRNTLWWWHCLLVQYMILSPIITVLSFVAGLDGVFDESSYSLDDAHLYLTVTKTISVTLAFTALFYLYLATKVVIHGYNPTGKFISIKLVIFLSFWQYLTITTAVSYGVFPVSVLRSVLSWSHGATSLDDQEIALCNLLLCVEMFVTAVMHHFVFDVDSCVAAEAHGHKHGDGNSTNKKKSDTALRTPMSFSDAVRHAARIDDLWAATRSTTEETLDAVRNVRKEKAQ